MSWSINVNAYMIWNQFNHKKILFIRISVHNDGGKNQRNNDSGLNQKTDVIFMTCNAQTVKNDNANNNNWSYEHAF